MGPIFRRYGTFREVCQTPILLEFHTFLLLLHLATWLRHNMTATLVIALKARSRLPQARPKCLWSLHIADDISASPSPSNFEVTFCHLRFTNARPTHHHDNDVDVSQLVFSLWN